MSGLWMGAGRNMSDQVGGRRGEVLKKTTGKGGHFRVR